MFVFSETFMKSLGEQTTNQATQFQNKNQIFNNRIISEDFNFKIQIVNFNKNILKTHNFERFVLEGVLNYDESEFCCWGAQLCVHF